MNKHTPGPWKISGPHEDGSAGIYSGDSYTSESSVLSIGKKGVKNESDLALIASAPDLLEALEYCGALIQMRTVKGAKEVIALKMAASAIAKANGEA